MVTLNYNAVEYDVKYIDPTISSAGDGSTPSTALKNLPDPLVDSTCYIIRRTNTESQVDLPKSTNIGIKHIIFLGMPKSDSIFYDLLEEDVKSAWADEVNKFANVRCNSSTYANSNVNCLFFENNLIDLISENCYFYRDGESGSATSYLNPIFYNESRTPLASYIFNNCKFGYAQYDIDDISFLSSNSTLTTDTSKYPQNKCCGYLSVNKIVNLSLNNCIINHVLNNKDASQRNELYYGINKSFYCKDVKKLILNNIVYNRLLYIYESNASYSPTYNAITTENAQNVYVKDNTFNLIAYNNIQIGNVRCLYLSSKKVNMDNVNVKLLSMKGASPTSCICNTSIIHLKDVYQSYHINNINADFTTSDFKVPHLCVIYFENFGGIQWGNISNYIKNINVKFIEDWESLNIKRYITDYPVVNINISSSNYSNSGSWTTNDSLNYRNITKGSICDNINISSPFGKALELVRCGARTSLIKGNVTLDSATLEADKIYNWNPTVPGITISNNSYLKCNDYEAKLDNELYPYTGQLQISYTKNQGVSIYVGKTNSLLFDELYTTTSNENTNNSMYICPNYIVTGQFIARNEYCFAKSWNVVRTGSTSNASLRFNNNYNNSVSTNDLNIALEPYKGIELTPLSTGKKILTCYLALKNFVDVSKGPQLCGITVNVPETIEDNTMYHSYYSPSYGWKKDDSTWSNDVDLSTFKIEIPIEVKETTNPIEVKIWYGWYDVQGFVYFDPDFKITDVL